MLPATFQGSSLRTDNAFGWMAKTAGVQNYKSRTCINTLSQGWSQGGLKGLPIPRAELDGSCILSFHAQSIQWNTMSRLRGPLCNRKPLEMRLHFSNDLKHPTTCLVALPKNFWGPSVKQNWPKEEMSFHLQSFLRTDQLQWQAGSFWEMKEHNIPLAFGHWIVFF